MRAAVKSTFIALAITALAAISLAEKAWADLPDEKILREVGSSIVRVHAESCTGPNAVGTGFVWSSRRQVVTALHVIAGCSAISVYSETARRFIGARVANVLRRADLALLELDDDAPGNPLPVTSARPNTHADVVAVGYALQVPTMGTTPLKVSFGSDVLKDVIPDTVRAELEAAGSPATDIAIIRLAGDLVPGLSGAPIVDATGAVAAVANGGLQNGMVGISWGLPVDNLRALQSSTDTIGQAAADRSRSLFSVDIESTRGAEITCGGVAFTHVRTMTFEEIVPTTDDPASMMQVLSQIMIGGVDMTDVAYDVYQAIGTGGTIAVPANATVSSGETCTANFATQTMSLDLQVAAFNGTRQQQEIYSVQFENWLATVYGTHLWEVDPQWTYTMPRPRFDDFIVNRKGFYGYNNTNGAIDGFAAETLMSKGNSFVGVALIARGVSTDMINYCAMNTYDANCAPIAESVKLYATVYVGVFLSAFSVG